jgi:hypothetical protein
MTARNSGASRLTLTRELETISCCWVCAGRPSVVSRRKLAAFVSPLIARLPWPSATITGDFDSNSIRPQFCDHSVTSADVRLSVGPKLSAVHCCQRPVGLNKSGKKAKKTAPEGCQAENQQRSRVTGTQFTTTLAKREGFVVGQSRCHCPDFGVPTCFMKPCRRASHMMSQPTRLS